MAEISVEVIKELVSVSTVGIRKVKAEIPAKRVRATVKNIFFLFLTIYSSTSFPKCFSAIKRIPIITIITIARSIADAESF